MKLNLQNFFFYQNLLGQTILAVWERPFETFSISFFFKVKQGFWVTDIHCSRNDYKG